MNRIFVACILCLIAGANSIAQESSIVKITRAIVSNTKIVSTSGRRAFSHRYTLFLIGSGRYSEDSFGSYGKEQDQNHRSYQHCDFRYSTTNSEFYREDEDNVSRIKDFWDIMDTSNKSAARNDTLIISQFKNLNVYNKTPIHLSNMQTQDALSIKSKKDIYDSSSINPKLVFKLLLQQSYENN